MQSIVPQLIGLVAQGFVTASGGNLINSIPLSAAHPFWFPLEQALAGVGALHNVLDS